MMRLKIVKVLIFLLTSANVFAENGHELWLRYVALPSNVSNVYQQQIKSISVTEQSPTINAATAEFQRAAKGLWGATIDVSSKLTDHSLVIGTAKNKTIVNTIGPKAINALGNDGFIIKQLTVNKKSVTIIAAKTDAGLLYGAFALIRHIQMGLPLVDLAIEDKPTYQKRLLNHWDNLNGTVERGYAGHSIFWDDSIPEAQKQSHLIDYARANASIGINGTVINNVNATPQMLSREYLQKTAAIAALLRPYKIKVYLSINFSSPKELGGLATSDPLNPEVANWWKNKAKEIYQLIPDFGGFLVKANSEGLPGPQDYGRTHADGANMLANALKPYGGLVMWRAFVYKASPEDRAKQAHSEFTPLDGQFRDNVIVQVKNGPIDFQPREPISPLFGAMQKTPLMLEFQITQEYMGFSNHLVFLAPMYSECLTTDTYCKGQGSTVAKTTDGSLFGHKVTAIAGVANIGNDKNWCGHHFAQANWYAFGRLAWNHSLTSKQIADEWLKMTFSHDTHFVAPISEMMLQSHETCVNYMTPLGLHHIMGWDHHYGPEPWCEIPNARADWLPKYYHRASEDGLGFDRSSTGTNATAQYFEPLRSIYNDKTTCPLKYLLWFHHVNWTDTVASGQTIWNTLVSRYYDGAAQTKQFQRSWDAVETLVDAERFKEVQYKLKIQARDAIWWRDGCLLYFQTFSHQPIPLQYERPLNDLDDLMKIKLKLGHHN